MSHTGRCFRSARRTRVRKEAQGKTYDFPIRYKVPVALRPFLANAAKGQHRAQFDQMATAIVGYNKHRALTGQGAAIRAEGQPASP